MADHIDLDEMAIEHRSDGSQTRQDALSAPGELPHGQHDVTLAPPILPPGDGYSYPQPLSKTVPFDAATTTPDDTLLPSPPHPHPAAKGENPGSPIESILKPHPQPRPTDISTLPPHNLSSSALPPPAPEMKQTQPASTHTPYPPYPQPGQHTPSASTTSSPGLTKPSQSQSPTSTTSKRLLSHYIAQHPDHRVSNAIYSVFPRPNPFLRLINRFKVKHSVIDGLSLKEIDVWERKMGKEMRRKAGWKLPDEDGEGVVVGELFWKVCPTAQVETSC